MKMSNKFKVGDKVIRIETKAGPYRRGYIGVVTKVGRPEIIKVDGKEYTNSQCWELLESTSIEPDGLNDGKKYAKTIFGLCGTAVEVDVYRVLDAYPTGDAALDHAIKKALNAGNRGHKDKITDYKNIEESARKARILLEQKMAHEEQKE